jgi:hypothetical protein
MVVIVDGKPEKGAPSTQAQPERFTMSENAKSKNENQPAHRTATSEETEGQEAPASNVLSSSDSKGDAGEDAKRNPDAPQHGGYGRPV